MMIKNDNNLMIPRITATIDFNDFKQIFETDKYKNIYGSSFIGKLLKKIDKTLQ